MGRSTGRDSSRALAETWNLNNRLPGAHVRVPHLDVNVGGTLPLTNGMN